MIKQQINKLKKERAEYERQQKKTQEELERLKKAKHKIDGKMQSFETFQQKVKSLQQKITPSDFKGTLRDKFDDKISSMDQKLQSEQNVFQRNMANLDMMIAKKELEVGEIAGSISYLANSILNLIESLG